MPINGESELGENASERDDKASTPSCGHAAGHGMSGHTRNGDDEEIENGSPDTRDEETCGTHERRNTERFQP